MSRRRDVSGSHGDCGEKWSARDDPISGIGADRSVPAAGAGADSCSDLRHVRGSVRIKSRLHLHRRQIRSGALVGVARCTGLNNDQFIEARDPPHPAWFLSSCAVCCIELNEASARELNPSCPPDGGAGPTKVPAQPERPARRRCPPSAVGPGRAPIGYRRLPRTSSRWAVHSDVCPSFVDELPCQPHTQVTCCSRCTYWSITCLRGSSVAVAEDLGGLGFTDTLLGWLTARRGLRRGPPIVRHSRGFGRTRAYGSVRSIRMAATGWRVDPDRASASGGSSGARRPGRRWPPPRSARATPPGPHQGLRPAAAEPCRAP